VGRDGKKWARNLAYAVVAALALIPRSGAEGDAAPPATSVLPGDVAWRPDPRGPGIHVATLSGDPKTAGPYVLRVKMAAGSRLPPHRHPDVRFVTVLSGTFLLGFGDTFDPAALRAYPAGSLVVIPAGVSHFGLVKDGESITQDNGWGPTGTY
jgi:quercetin dioxygenase-like cupin family protein